MIVVAIFALLFILAAGVAWLALAMYLLYALVRHLAHRAAVLLGLDGLHAEPRVGRPTHRHA